MRKISLFFLCFVSFASASDDISKLLKEYRSEAELSKITKVESAGFVDIYTREDLEQMQAHTLLDVLKSLPTLTVTRTSNDLTLFSKPSVHYMPLPAIKLYINDHDVTSASAGSTVVMWADMPIEHINHIEVYKAASSIEFSNEPGTAIIKLYTKKAEREEGGKLKIIGDQKGSYGLDTYFAHTSLGGTSYFFYATKNDTKREKYYNQGYEFNSNKNSYNLYANITHKDLHVELSHYSKKNNDFMGIGTSYTPIDGGIDIDQSYIHISKTFENDFKFQIAYDYLNQKRTYKDDNGISAGAAGLVDTYYDHHKDTVFSIIGEKKFHFDNNRLLLGGLYKYKGLQSSGEYGDAITHHSNYLNLYSIYAENSYYFDEKTMLITSLKGDFYKFGKEVKSQNELTARIGLIKNINHFQFKVFVTRSYYPVELVKLYNEDNIPHKVNPDLKYPQMNIYMASVNYKNGDYETELRASIHALKDNIAFAPTGFINSPSEAENQFYVFKQTYHFNRDNKIILDLFSGDNIKDLQMSPKYGLNLRSFNSFGKWNIYNEFIIKSNYKAFGVAVGSSIDYAAAIKYNFSSNFSMGVKGQNIFNKGYEQAYRNFSYSIPVTDQKVWISLEYLF